MKHNGILNAKCEKGDTAEQRRKLNLVPDEYRESVRLHLIAVWKLNKKAELAKRRKEDEKRNQR